MATRWHDTNPTPPKPEGNPMTAHDQVGDELRKWTETHDRNVRAAVELLSSLDTHNRGLVARAVTEAVRR